MLTLFRRSLANIPKRRYLDTIKLFPGIKHENTQRFTSLILTFAALIFFGLFAINPTLSTITKLRKELVDSKFVDEQLTTKIGNLSILQQQYTALSTDLPQIFAAVPENPQAPLVLGQVQTLATNAGLRTVTMKVNTVEIAKSVKEPKKDSSFTFSYEAVGSETAIIAFLKSLTSFDRIITLESISMKRDIDNQQAFVVTILARSFYKQTP